MLVLFILTILTGYAAGKLTADVPKKYEDLTDPKWKGKIFMAEKVGEYLLAPGICPPIDGIDKAKVIPIRELLDDEFKKIFAEK